MNEQAKDYWVGRIDDADNYKSFRYHQIVERIDINQQATLAGACVIIGFECEEGVKRNKGQLGAVSAPNALRSELAKLPWIFPSGNRLIDAGNIACTGNQLEEAQQALGQSVTHILKNKGVPLLLGGGHETAYGHYLGVRDAIGPHKSLGIINIDAHFDLRSYNEQPSSGTMFKQILEQDEHASYFVVGIQRYGNTQELVDTADDLGVTYVFEEDMQPWELESTLNALSDFMDQHDYVLLTLCTDVLNAAFAPGVSASSPFGLDPTTVRSLIRVVVAHEKTGSFDISEVNPKLDENKRTVKLGAYLVNEAITAFLKRE